MPTKSFNVDRDHYAKVLGVHKRTLLRTCQGPLQRWDEYLKRDLGGLSELGRRFIALLEPELADPSRIVRRGKRINISHYARLFGVTPRGVIVAAGDRLPALEQKIQRLRAQASKKRL